MTLEAGTLLGAYRIVAPIGAGGMGEVFLAQDSRLERNVALKILPRAFAGDAERLGRFVREAKSASALNHPNILTIHEIGMSEGFHYLATELIVGETLRERIARGALPVADCLEIAIQVAAALGAAHAAGIVHRDVKPENVMIRADGLVKVLDFGLAKWSEPQVVDPQGVTVDRGRTHPGVVLGTVAYMSPEQSRGKTVDARTDLWSLGVVLYEMLSGRQPFEGESSTDVLANILHREPPPLALEAEDLAPEIGAILGRALAKERLARYATSRELTADLKSAQKRLQFDAELGRSPSPGGSAVSGGVAGPASAAGSASASSPARGSTGSGAALPRHAIAVLPFRNLSAEAENDYFCDGLAEELLNALAKIDGFKVAARTSAFAFRDKPAGISEIGRALGVTTVLEGSVRTSRGRMRIAVQLVNAADGFHLWSERYDREMRDIFDVQDEITLAIVDALKIKLFGDERTAALKRGTENAEAHELYLRGRFSWNQRTAEAVRRAADYYQEAIAQDPRYALAHAGLAECYVLYPWLSVAPPHDSMPKARTAALRALELDDDLAEAHAALGVYLSFYAWDQPASERELRRAIELKPSSATAYHWLGNIALLAMGRWDESLAAERRAGELDPLSLSIAADTGVTLLYARRFDEAIAQFRRTLAVDPKFYVARYHLGLALHARGEYDAAIAEYRICLASDDDPWVTALLAFSLAKAGRRDEALEQRAKLIAESAGRYVPNVGLAIVHAALGENDEALRWLERDFEERSLFPPFYAWDPVFDDLRADPRFADLVRRVGQAKLADAG